VPYEAPEDIARQLAELERELDSEALRTQLVVALDATSRLPEGQTASLWLDLRKVHVFDPASGANLTMEAPDAAPGAGPAAGDDAVPGAQAESVPDPPTAT
jgi:multiple sugar transport system ATP-binding protein